ncbi:putative phage abortive infection protein [Flavobacterium sp. FlaQc-52]|uniref:putative phage abortive infection protein n=1 Tax=Flavobacterium sp. FlaQc-52 TaxID=3374185 RepID=UPI0037578796
MKVDNDNLRFIAILLAVTLFWVLGWIYVETMVPLDKQSDFGNKFGFINSLFSGLALAVIIYSIRLQQAELSLQRKELSETREEFKDQNFQTTFFNLLKTQQQIPNDINVTISDLKDFNEYENRTVKGREFFVNAKIELSRIKFALKQDAYMTFSDWEDYLDQRGAPIDDEEGANLLKRRKATYTNQYYGISKVQWEHSKTLEPVQFALFCYKLFFKKFQFAIGHYFRHMYHILLFLEETETDKINKRPESETKEIKKEFQRYANFVQAQMATPELFLLFYNSLFFAKIQKALIKYKILDNLLQEDLIDIEHNNIEGIKLKSIHDLN